MAALSRILRSATDNGLMFWCPGCECMHMINHGAGAEPRWAWNGDVDKPTFSPSILVMRGSTNPSAPLCHSFVTDGRIHFLPDSTHALAGQTVDLPPWDGGDE